MDNSEEYFQKLQDIYPNLNGVTYKQDALYFPEGTIFLNGINLKDIPEFIFTMKRYNIYSYIGNSYYKSKEDEIDHVFNLFMQLVITEEEKSFLIQFAKDYFERLRLANEESILKSDIHFFTELNLRQKVISESFKRPLVAADIIAKAYSDITSEYMNKENNDNSIDMDMSLTRNKNGVPKVIEDESSLGIKGFMSVTIILGVIIFTGMYIAYKLIN